MLASHCQKKKITVLYVEITICTMTSAEIAPTHATHIRRLHAMIHGMRPTLVTRRVNLLRCVWIISLDAFTRA